ncbi:MAG: hypothetical protein HY282_00010 [Nitrospirae bacterium]|nr:hypothetical protein [Candidatus Manganitrophaceae bacterium]
MFDESRNPPPRNRIDRFIRQFRYPAYFIALTLLYAIASTAIGLALSPALWFLSHWAPWSASFPGWLRWPLLGTGLGFSFFISGMTLLVVIPIYNWLLPTRIKPFKGTYFTLAAVPWFVHNGLFYLVRYTFLKYVTLTPLGIGFLRAMGMTIGERAFINTDLISDPRMLTLGDDVVVGGSVRIFAHYGGGGKLVIAPVFIGNRATIGLNATVMGDVSVGAGATILAHSVLLPGSRVGEGETWGGVPARRISREEMERIKKEIQGLPTNETLPKSQGIPS